MVMGRPAGPTQGGGAQLVDSLALSTPADVVGNPGMTPRGSLGSLGCDQGPATAMLTAHCLSAVGPAAWPTS
jgi:hypothetical protein